MASLPDAVPVDKLESLLTCSICLETLNDPRTLPCFHSFCECCLAKFVKKQRDKVVGKEIEAFDCPTCRSVFTLKPKEEVKEMSGSHFIRNMLDVVAIQRQAKIAKCSHCEKTATCRCISCEVFMCEQCFTIHESWPGFKKHSVLTITELSEPENQGKVRAKLHCKEHKDKKLKFYCETCQELICRYCMDFEHVRPDHSCLPVEKVAKKQKEALKTSFGILNTKLMEGNEALQAILNATAVLKVDARKAKDEIIKQKEEVKKKIEDGAAIKINEVDEGYNEQYEQLTKQENEMKSFVEKIKGSVALSQNLLERGNNEEIASCQKMIEGSLEMFQKEMPGNLELYSCNSIHYKVTSTDYGHLTLQFLNTLGIIVNKSQMYGILSNASIILKDKPEFVEQMVEWLKEHGFKWRLCYRASRDGWKATDFHAHCDNKPHTVTVVEVGDNIFGGFTDQNWEGHGLKRSTASFLFSLKNKDNLPPFQALIKNPENAIFANKECGPLFGNNQGNFPDLCIVSQSHISRKSYSRFNQAYNLPKEYKISNTSSLLAGAVVFTTTEIEVFY